VPVRQKVAVMKVAHRAPVRQKVAVMKVAHRAPVRQKVAVMKDAHRVLARQKAAVMKDAHRVLARQKAAVMKDAHRVPAPQKAAVMKSARRENALLKSVRKVKRSVPIDPQVLPVKTVARALRAMPAVRRERAATATVLPESAVIASKEPKHQTIRILFFSK